MTSAENQLDNLIHPVIVQAINRLSAEDFVSNKEALNAALARGWPPSTRIWPPAASR
jgi:hypothetical protein